MAGQLLPVRGQRLRRTLVRQLLPYCCVETRGGMLLLNRNYKPLGWPIEGRSRVDYEDPEFDSLRVIPSLEFDGLQRIGMHLIANDDGRFWFFYGGDVDPPWKGQEAMANYEIKLCRFLDWSINKEGGL